MLAIPAGGANSAKSMGFLDAIHRVCGRVAGMLDYAPYKSERTGEKLEELSGYIKPAFLPPYTPQINTAKVRAAAFKKRNSYPPTIPRLRAASGQTRARTAHMPGVEKDCLGRG